MLIERMCSPVRMGKNYLECIIYLFINCSTTRMVYMLTCPCGKAYIGKINRQLKIRIGKHIGSLRKKDDECSLALHFLQFCDSNPNGLKIKGIYALNLPLRRWDFDTILELKEKMVIFRLGTLMPNGLYTECNLAAFLET